MRPVNVHARRDLHQQQQQLFISNVIDSNGNIVWPLITDTEWEFFLFVERSHAWGIKPQNDLAPQKSPAIIIGSIKSDYESSLSFTSSSSSIPRKLTASNFVTNEQA